MFATDRPASPPRFALHAAIVVILASWVWQVLSHPGGAALPAEFSQFVLRIARKKLLVLLAIVALLRLGGEGPASVGLARRDWLKRVGVGLAFGAGMFVVFNVVLNSILSGWLPRTAAAGPSVMTFLRDPANLAAWLPIGILGGGFVEELQRVFVLTRFEHRFGRPGLAAALVLGSLVFGHGHLYQGPGAALGTALSGAAFALLYLRRRSALEPMVAHAFADVLAILAATLLAH